VGAGEFFVTTGVLEPFELAAGVNMLRTTETGVLSAVSDSGGGGGGKGTGGAIAPARVVVEATSGLTEVDLLVGAASDDFELEVSFARGVAGAAPAFLRTLVQRRPRKVVMFDSIQTAVESACGVKVRMNWRSGNGQY
jgi:hypothetical protein